MQPAESRGGHERIRWPATRDVTGSHPKGIILLTTQSESAGPETGPQTTLRCLGGGQDPLPAAPSPGLARAVALATQFRHTAPHTRTTVTVRLAP